ncbi:hypothetical protein M378DRAFT_166800 [Amanita muscaria Koide BX008]|uniref:Uncharacterized protein n=1 Tax=Amanita muscaria (strain Koide BX008) TaxID=946122 RepID=A0A0C2WYR5_AMAMK|nr:hypothetical protein M378DRAFT_166800 [Amanita muscaria Koide BX008]
MFNSYKILVSLAIERRLSLDLRSFPSHTIPYASSRASIHVILGPRGLAVVLAIIDSPFRGSWSSGVIASLYP